MMHPAGSVILFTTLSGAGYGLLVWIALWMHVGDPPPARLPGMVSLVIALGLVTTGLLSSTFHLGHRERAWRALGQWRTSWLSREGVAAVATFFPWMGVGAAWLYQGTGAPWHRLLATAGAVLALLTLICTGMIYASLKTVPRWNNNRVPMLYLLFGLATGGLAFMPVTIALGQPPGGWIAGSIVGLALAAWLVKLLYWRAIDRMPPRYSMASATGLPAPVRSLEAPHTAPNYLLREMGFAVARKHAVKLRRIALTAGIASAVLAVPAALLPGWAAILFALFALLAAALAVAVERWLFFAEAEHAVTLFYGAAGV